MGEKVLSQYIAEKQHLQAHGPPVSTKLASAVTKLWRNKPPTNQIVKYDHQIRKILKAHYLILRFWKIKPLIVFIKDG